MMLTQREIAKKRCELGAIPRNSGAIRAQFCAILSRVIRPLRPAHVPPKLEVHLVAPVEGLADSFDAAAREEAAKKAGGGAPQMQLRIDEDMYERLMSVSYYFKW